ncbi:MAG: AEC family transporter [Chloroflexota bacterium]
MPIFTIIFPVFAIAGIGYALTFFGVFTMQHIGGLSRYVFVVAIPVLLFRSLATIALPEQIEWEFLLSYYLAALLIYGLSMLASRLLFGHSLQEQGIFGMGSAYSNLVLVGLPIILRAFGDDAALPMFLLISFHGAIIFFVVTAVSELGDSQANSLGQTAVLTLKNLAKNNIIAALMLGLLFNRLAIPLPDFIDSTLETISRSALPCALFVLGASLTQYKLSGQLGESAAILFFKLLLHPLFAYFFAFIVFDLSPLWGSVVVVGASLPVGINTYVFAEKYETGIATTATAVLLSTLAATITLPIALSLFIPAG